MATGRIKPLRSPSDAIIAIRRTGSLDKKESGLYSVSGAEEIISNIVSRGTIVKKLVLGHNELGDDGCVVLFRFLSSEVGRRNKISCISLNSNGIGNTGLSAISEYLNDNEDLQELFLQNVGSRQIALVFFLYADDPAAQNNFNPGEKATAIFTNAINSSCLSLLSIASNRQLSDAFVHVFLPGLKSLRLKELHMSGIGMTPHAGSYIMDYIRSPERCRLHTLTCSGNSLGLNVARQIIQTIENDNFTITTFDCFSNRLSDYSAFDSFRVDGEDSYGVWKEAHAVLKVILSRNLYLQRETERQAFLLLRYSRPLLLCSRNREKHNEPLDDQSVKRVLVSEMNDSGVALVHFVALPPEVQFHILSFLAPVLSNAQLIRILQYASSPDTLPSLLPCLVRTPSSSAYTQVSRQSSQIQTSDGSQDHVRVVGRCSDSSGSLCRRDRDRENWLELVGCAYYER